MGKRQIVLDTETTGIDPKDGHRIIEIGCVELIERRLTGREFHTYINPEREVDAGAYKVHGLDNSFLSAHPVFSEVHEKFLEFIGDAELIIHNAPFDLGFLDSELVRQKHTTPLHKSNKIIDTLVMARQKHPGQRNSLDALCKRYGVDNSKRDLHGALLDSKILATVYLALTSGQDNLFADSTDATQLASQSAEQQVKVPIKRGERLTVIMPTDSELLGHREHLEKISQTCNEEIEW